MDKTDARLQLSSKLRLIKMAVVRLPISPAVVEIVSGGDAMLQMVERTQQAEPVHILSAGLTGSLDVQVVDPREKRFISGQPTIRRLPEVTMRGNEPWNDPVSMCVEDRRTVQAGRRIPGCDCDDRSIFAHHQVASERFTLLRRHGKQPCILDHQFCRSAKEVGGEEEPEKDKRGGPHAVRISRALAGYVFQIGPG